MPKKEVLVRICPKCGSRNVERGAGGRAMSPYYVCKSCGFAGTLFPEIRLKDAKKMEETAAKYSSLLAPTKKPISIPLILFFILLSTIIFIALIILGR